MNFIIDNDNQYYYAAYFTTKKCIGGCLLYVYDWLYINKL